MTTPERLRRRQRIESALIGVLCILLVGAWLYFRGRADDASSDVQAQADAVQAQADANSAINECLSTWAQDLTEALQDRDAVSRTARAAQAELWAEVDAYLRGTSPDRATLTDAIRRFRQILRRLDRTASINPYPEISPCFAVASAEAAAVVALVSYLSARTCWGHPVTIRGTRGADTLIGTDDADVIFAGRGDDLIVAARGNDYVCAGRGDDTINGGPGRDAVRGGLGADLCIQTELEKGC